MVVASSIIDAGNRFEIELAATDCRGGKTFAKVRQGADKREEIVHALGLAAAQLRRKLGEPSASIAEYNQPLEIATSSSPEALQLLAQGYKHLVVRDISARRNPFINRPSNWTLTSRWRISLSELCISRACNSTRLLLQKRRPTHCADRMTVAGSFPGRDRVLRHRNGELDKVRSGLLALACVISANLIARFNYAYCLIGLGDRMKPQPTSESRS